MRLRRTRKRESALPLEEIREVLVRGGDPPVANGVHQDDIGVTRKLFHDEVRLAVVLGDCTSSVDGLCDLDVVPVVPDGTGFRTTVDLRVPDFRPVFLGSRAVQILSRVSVLVDLVESDVTTTLRQDEGRSI